MISTDKSLTRAVHFGQITARNASSVLQTVKKTSRVRGSTKNKRRASPNVFDLTLIKFSTDASALRQESEQHSLEKNIPPIFISEFRYARYEIYLYTYREREEGKGEMQVWHFAFCGFTHLDAPGLRNTFHGPRRFRHVLYTYTVWHLQSSICRAIIIGHYNF